MSFLAATFIEGMAAVCIGCLGALIVLVGAMLHAQSKVGRDIDEDRK